MRSQDQWLEWAKELQALSQSALAYCRDKYDIERFRRIREISGEMMASLTGLPVEKVRAVFLNEEGYQTPKLDTRAAVIRDGKILMVQEGDGRWSLPGGWCDVDQSVAENAVKEGREEAGVVARPVRLNALLDHNRHTEHKSIHEVTSAFVLCEYVSGAFLPNLETRDARFFTMEEATALNLSTGKTTVAQIEMCFRAAADERWEAILD